MNMTPKGYIFHYENGKQYEIIASSLAEATSELPIEHSNYESYTNVDLHHVIRLNEDGQHEIIASYFDEEHADELFETLSERYPHGFYDVTLNPLAH